jgi:hypothetical protein
MGNRKRSASEGAGAATGHGGNRGRASDFDGFCQPSGRVPEVEGRGGWVKDVFVYVGEGWWKGKNATVAPRREKILEVANPTRETLMRIARERGQVGSLGCMRVAGAIRGDRKGGGVSKTIPGSGRFVIRLGGDKRSPEKEETSDWMKLRWSVRIPRGPALKCGSKASRPVAWSS